MKLEICTVVWGPMLRMYIDACIPALLQPNNIPAAKDVIAGYTVYTNAPDLLRESSAFRKLNDIIPVTISPLKKGENNVTACLVDILTRDLSLGIYTYVLGPDFILGDGSFKYLAEVLREGKDQLFAYGFPRVTMKTYDHLVASFSRGEVVDNPQLVEIAMRDVHPESSDRDSGITITQRDARTWDVKHRVPTIVVKPDQDVVNYMLENSSNNSGFDHCVPILCVKNNFTVHYVNDSNNFFMVEPTDRSRALCREISRSRDYHKLGIENRDHWDRYSCVWHY